MDGGFVRFVRFWDAVPSSKAMAGGSRLTLGASRLHCIWSPFRPKHLQAEKSEGFEV